MLPCSLPLKCKKDMAEQDIREDQMTITNTVDYVRGLKGKDSVLMAISTLFLDVMKERGYLTYNSEDEVNSAIIPGSYSHGGPIIGTSGKHGILLILKSNTYIAQLDFNFDNKFFFRYSSNNGSTWSDWKSVTLT
nr:MAG TPA: hypothetical protein [Caudoviricetes sp.]